MIRDEQALEAIALARYDKALDCVDMDKVYDLLYRADEIADAEGLSPRKQVEFCVSNCCFSLPSEIKRIVADRMGNKWYWGNKKAETRSVQWKYLSASEDELDCNSNRCGKGLIQDEGDGFATYTDLKCPMKIYAFSDREECEDSELRVYAHDDEGKINRKALNPEFGLPLKLRLQQIDFKLDQITDYPINTPYQITKTRTKGYISVFGVTVSRKKIVEMVWLTTMHPDETSTNYRRYLVPSASKSSPVSIKAIVNLRPQHKYRTDGIAFVQMEEYYRKMAYALKLEHTDVNKYLAHKNMALKLAKQSIAEKRDPNEYESINHESFYMNSDQYLYM